MQIRTYQVLIENNIIEAELDAQNKAKQVTDVENEDFKVNYNIKQKKMREEIRSLKTDIDDEEKLLSHY